MPIVGDNLLEIYFWFDGIYFSYSDKSMQMMTYKASVENQLNICEATQKTEIRGERHRDRNENRKPNKFEYNKVYEVWVLIWGNNCMRNSLWKLIRNLTINSNSNSNWIEIGIEFGRSLCEIGCDWDWYQHLYWNHLLCKSSIDKNHRCNDTMVKCMCYCAHGWLNSM